MLSQTSASWQAAVARMLASLDDKHRISKLTTLVRKTLTHPSAVVGGYSTNICADKDAMSTGSYICSSFGPSLAHSPSPRRLHAGKNRQVRSTLIGSRFCTTSRMFVMDTSDDGDHWEKNGDTEVCFSASNSLMIYNSRLSEGDKVPPYACTRGSMYEGVFAGRR